MKQFKEILKSTAVVIIVLLAGEIETPFYEFCDDVVWSLFRGIGCSYELSSFMTLIIFAVPYAALVHVVFPKIWNRYLVVRFNRSTKEEVTETDTKAYWMTTKELTAK